MTDDQPIKVLRDLYNKKGKKTSRAIKKNVDVLIISRCESVLRPLTWVPLRKGPAMSPTRVKSLGVQ